MPQVSYTPHPSSNKFSKSITVGAGSSDAVLFYLIPKYYVLSISSISVPLKVSGSNADTQYRWNNALSWGGSSVYQRDNRNSGLKSSFNPARQILCLRVQCTNVQGTSNKKFTINQPSINPSVTIATVEQINPGDPLVTPMNNLKTYLDQLSSGTRIATSVTIPEYTEGTIIVPSDLDNLILKANSFPHVNGLVVPAVDASIDASYYNNLITNIIPPV